MAEDLPPFAQAPLQERMHRIETMSRICFGQNKLPPSEIDLDALRRMQEIEEELDLIAAFGGFDALRFAQSQEAHVVEEVRAYLRGKRAAGQG